MSNLWKTITEIINVKYEDVEKLLSKSSSVERISGVIIRFFILPLDIKIRNVELEYISSEKCSRFKKYSRYC